ncbi:MAG: hypothetical protein DRN17_07765, partial [Thermoplasmata archaeon]
MKSKIGMAFMVVALFIGTAAMAGMSPGVIVGNENKEVHESMQFSVHAPSPEIKAEEKYVTLDFGAETKYLHHASYPIMPYNSKVLTFPFGTKIESIDVKVGEMQTMHLDKKIAPSPEPVPLNGAEPKAAQEGAIYQSNEPYPSNWVEWNTGAGIENGKHVVFLSIHAFPARYIPAENELQYVDDISIEIK